MASFGTGILAAIVLAAGTYWVFQAGTVTMVERTNDRSTITGSVNLEQPAFREAQDVQ